MFVCVRAYVRVWGWNLNNIPSLRALYSAISPQHEGTVWVTKKYPFFIKQRPCNGNFAFRFRARSVLHITVFIFAAWAKLF